MHTESSWLPNQLVIDPTAGIILVASNSSSLSAFAAIPGQPTFADDSTGGAYGVCGDTANNLFLSYPQAGAIGRLDYDPVANANILVIVVNVTNPRGIVSVGDTMIVALGDGGFMTVAIGASSPSVLATFNDSRLAGASGLACWLVQRCAIATMQGSSSSLWLLAYDSVAASYNLTRMADVDDLVYGVALHPTIPDAVLVTRRVHGDVLVLTPPPVGGQSWAVSMRIVYSPTGFASPFGIAVEQNAATSLIIAEQGSHTLANYTLPVLL